MARTHIVGESAWTKALRERIKIVAGLSSSVLITGPSGTGKELLARTIHETGPCGESFVAVDCTAITGDLFASHLFGHVKGAFTGANSDRLGCFRAAEHGTILLDEIGELGAELQATLLRVLQERVVVPVGSEQAVPIDVRVIAATNRDLQEEVRIGRFRLDLFYRLNVIALETVALCDRLEEIEPLANHHLARVSAEQGLPCKRLSPAALAVLRSYSWPGNVRELQNVVERPLIFSVGERIEPLDLPCDAGTAINASCGNHRGLALMSAEPLPAEDSENWQSLAQIECDHIQKTLSRTHYNQSAAAELLNIDRASLARKITRFGIAMPAMRLGRPRKDSLPPASLAPLN